MTISPYFSRDNELNQYISNPKCVFWLAQPWVPSPPIWLSEKDVCEKGNQIFSLLMLQVSRGDSSHGFVQIYHIKIIEANIMLVHTVIMQMIQHWCLYELNWVFRIDILHLL